ncbi:hypothetical protein LXL04_029440 [Taraxacum kok-saghyz]
MRLRPPFSLPSAASSSPRDLDSAPPSLFSPPNRRRSTVATHRRRRPTSGFTRWPPGISTSNIFISAKQEATANLQLTHRHQAHHYHDSPAPASSKVCATASSSPFLISLCSETRAFVRISCIQATTSFDFVYSSNISLMDGTSVEPLAQSVAGSTTNQMEGIEGEEQSAPKPAPPNQNPSEDATDKDQMEEEVILKRKRKKTSKIWDHFTIVTGDGTQKEQALCMYCKSKIYYDGTTSTCLRHLQSCKPHNDHIQKQQLLNFPPSMSSIDAGQKKLPTLIRPDNYDSNKMREAIATWVMGTKQPFSVDCTTIIFGSDYPTSNLYLIEVFRVKVTLDKGAQSENFFIRHMVTEMKEKFDKYWGECHLVMAIASVIDPRFKMKLVEFSFPSTYTDADKQIEEVKKALYMMYEEYLEIHDISVREATSPGSSCSGNTGLEKTPLGSGWEAFGDFIKNADLEKLEKEQGQKGMDSFKALEWWCVHKEKYHVLSKMAMDVLAIPVSTVASESTFSAGGRVIDAYRSSLGKETVQKLICGAGWIRHLYGIKKKLKEEMSTKDLLPTGKSNT